MLPFPLMNTRRVNLCLAGFGNVGRAVVRLLITKREELQERHGIDWRISGVSSRRIGWLADANGLDATALLAIDSQTGGIPATLKSAARVGNVRDWLHAAKCDALFEMTSLNRHSGEPAIEHLQAALESGAHAISANKGPVVFAYDELRGQAERAGRQFLFESAVMDGTPIFNLFRETLPVVELRGFRGLLNSTSNVVLSAMEQGLDLAAAIRRAQEIGVAETDPSDDLEGWDAAVKVAALSTVLMGSPMKPADVARTGIATLAPEQVRGARAEGKPYKLVCRARREGSRVQGSVAPEQLPLSDPLANLMGTTSCVHFEMDVFNLTIIEHKADVVATAYGLVSDLVRAVR